MIAVCLDFREQNKRPWEVSMQQVKACKVMQSWWVLKNKLCFSQSSQNNE